jgi:hypothetical protein
MPDANKLKVMREMGVRATECCCACLNLRSKGVRSGWGFCNIAPTYTHLKTGEVAKMPTHETFVCPSFERNARDIGSYPELLEENL